MCACHHPSEITFRGMAGLFFVGAADSIRIQRYSTLNDGFVVTDSRKNFSSLVCP
jgi:hypothetical protein